MSMLESVVETAVKGAVSATKKVIEITTNLCQNIFETLKTFYNDNQTIDRIDRNIDIAYLKSYKKKNNSTLVIAKVGSLLKNCEEFEFPRWINSIPDEYIIAEYLESSDNVIQADFVCVDKIAENIMNALDANDGIILIKE